MEGRQLRDRDAIALDLVGVAGISAFLIGLIWLQTSEKLGFDAGGALDGVVSQLPVTLTAGLLVLLATAIELGAGLVLARAARRRPFDSIAEALLAAMVAAVLKDTLLLGLLGGVGLFQGPILLGTNLAVMAIGVFAPPFRRELRPFAAIPGRREALASVGSLTIAALVLIVWAGPIVLQLASPVVPFIDVLPNYVGPVEHLRTFGWFETLTATQSPIIGPSRSVLGYDGLLGSLATMTGLSGALAIAGFILPQTILVGAGAYRLASAIRNGDPPVGAWALLAFALSQPFARLADARGTVVVVPLVCLGLAVAAEFLRDPRTEDEDPWRIGRGAVIGLALGAAILVHPVIGFFAVATVGIVALVRARDAAPDAAVAGLTAGLIAVPQLTTMLGLPLPTIALGIWLPIAVAVGIVVGRRVGAGTRFRVGLVRLAEITRIVLPAGAVAALVGGFVAGLLSAGKVPAALAYSLDLVLDSSGLLLVVLVAGAIFGSRGSRSPLVWSGLAVGAVAVFLTQVLPNGLGFLGSALQFEVPKTVHYWLSMIAAAGAASGLAFLWAPPRNPLAWLGRVAVAAFVIVAALPLRVTLIPEPGEIDAYHLGEHRWSETFAIDLRFADIGFWQGFPDSRTVVDEPRRELLDRLRAEIESGRLRHDTPVLHVASSFQQWVSTPLGVFDGVIETFLSGCADIGNPRCHGPEVSHQTVGGRLFHVADIHDYLDPGAFPFVVLEPRDLPKGLRDQILGAGYTSLFDNAQGEIFRAGS